jgi:hypothetical protein
MEPVVTRKPQHTGEWTEVEPLATFLRRRIWIRPDWYVPPSPKREGYRS